VRGLIIVGSKAHDCSSGGGRVGEGWRADGQACKGSSACPGGRRGGWLWLLEGVTAHARIFVPLSRARAAGDALQIGEKRGPRPAPARSGGGTTGEGWICVRRAARKSTLSPGFLAAHRRSFYSFTMSSQERVSRRQYSMDVATYRLPFHFWKVACRSFRYRPVGVAQAVGDEDAKKKNEV
jgi:hypothetical protein